MGPPTWPGMTRRQYLQRSVSWVEHVLSNPEDLDLDSKYLHNLDVWRVNCENSLKTLPKEELDKPRF